MLKIKSKKNRAIFIITSIILFAFILWNIVWIGYLAIKYRPYEKAVGYDGERNQYFYEDKEEYIYGVKKPNYLSFTGNLSISHSTGINTKNVRVEKDGLTPYTGVDIDAIIWPSFDGHYKILVSILEYNGEVDQNGESVLKAYSFLLDEYMKSIESLSETQKKELILQKENIKYIYNKINSIWNI